MVTAAFGIIFGPWNYKSFNSAIIKLLIKKIVCKDEEITDPDEIYAFYQDGHDTECDIYFHDDIGLSEQLMEFFSDNYDPKAHMLLNSSFDCFTEYVFGDCESPSDIYFTYNNSKHIKIGNGIEYGKQKCMAFITELSDDGISTRSAFDKYDKHYYSDSDNEIDDRIKHTDHHALKDLFEMYDNLSKQGRLEDYVRISIGTDK